MADTLTDGQIPNPDRGEVSDLLDRLDQLGILTRASKNPPPFRKTVSGPIRTSEEIDALLNEMRADYIDTIRAETH